MAGHLAPARVGVYCGANRTVEHLVRGHPQHQTERAITVVRVKPVVRRAEHQSGGDEDRFVSGPGNLEKDLVLPLELDLLVVDTARQVHRAIGRDELRARQRHVAGMLGNLAFGGARWAGRSRHYPSISGKQ